MRCNLIQLGALIIFLLLIIITTWRLSNKDERINKDAQEYATEFQHLYNAGEYAKMYTDTTPEFRTKAPYNDFSSLMNRKKEVLGAFTKSNLQSSNVINSKVVILTYCSYYEKYSVVEQFKYIQTSDGKLALGIYFLDDSNQCK